MHRDLKPENILMESVLENDLHIKVSDFGFTTYFRDSEKANNTLGTPFYMAPEVIKA